MGALNDPDSHIFFIFIRKIEHFHLLCFRLTHAHHAIDTVLRSCRRVYLEHLELKYRNDKSLIQRV